MDTLLVFSTLLMEVVYLYNQGNAANILHLIYGIIYVSHFASTNKYVILHFGVFFKIRFPVINCVCYNVGLGLTSFTLKPTLLKQQLHNKRHHSYLSNPQHHLTLQPQHYKTIFKGH